MNDNTKRWLPRASRLIEVPECWRVGPIDEATGAAQPATLTDIYDWAMANLEPGDRVHGVSAHEGFAHPSRYPFELHRKSCYVEGVIVRRDSVITLRCGEIAKYMFPELVNIIVPEASFHRGTRDFQPDFGQSASAMLYRHAPTGELKWVYRKRPSTDRQEMDYYPAHAGWAGRLAAIRVSATRPWELYTEEMSEEAKRAAFEHAATLDIVPSERCNLWTVLYNIQGETRDAIKFLEGSEAREYTSPELAKVYMLANEWRLGDRWRATATEERREGFYELIRQMREILPAEVAYYEPRASQA